MTIRSISLLTALFLFSFNFCPVNSSDTEVSFEEIPVELLDEIVQKFVNMIASEPFINLWNRAQAEDKSALEEVLDLCTKFRIPDLEMEENGTFTGTYLWNGDSR